MTEFRIVRATALTPEAAWRRVTDWPRHGRAMPLTTVRADGATVTARTALGRFGFDDVMDLAHWQPPHGDTPGSCLPSNAAR